MRGDCILIKKYTNNRGNSLIELIMFMMLFILFCLTTYTIIYSGSEAQQKISDNKDAQIDARIALSYISVKLRQNDEAGKISIEKNPINGENAIVIRNRADEEYFDTWIFCSDNTIYEFIGLPDETPDIDLSIAIIQSEALDYSINYDQQSNSINSKITYQYGKTKKEISSSMHLRAEL